MREEEVERGRERQGVRGKEGERKKDIGRDRGRSRRRNRKREESVCGVV